MLDTTQYEDSLELALLYHVYRLIAGRQKRRSRRQPYSISSLTGAMWVEQALIHPRRCQDCLGMSIRGFNQLVAFLEDKSLLIATKNMSVQEILAIGLHLFRHGAGHRQAGLTFNRSLSTISK